MRMTDIGIRTLKPKAQRYERWEDGRTGFGVRVSPSGRKTFVYMYWRNGKARRMTLGIYGDGSGNISLADANVKHAEAKKALTEGHDPGAETVEARQAERDAESVAELVEEYLGKWAWPRKRSAAEDERILRKEIVPQWGNRKARDIKRRDIITLLDGIVDRGAPIQANRTLACVRRMFNWAIERDMLDASPCVRVKAPAPENRRDRALVNGEIRTFWHGLDNARMSGHKLKAERQLHRVGHPCVVEPVPKRPNFAVDQGTVPPVFLGWCLDADTRAGIEHVALDGPVEHEPDAGQWRSPPASTPEQSPRTRYAIPRSPTWPKQEQRSKRFRTSPVTGPPRR